MNQQDRKTAIAAYKEQKTVAGVFAVICSATGEAWVGPSRHVDTQKNGLWFSLRQGTCRNPALQAAWTRYGEPDFRFEQLDRLPEDTSPVLRDLELKKRVGLWITRLHAAPL